MASQFTPVGWGLLPPEQPTAPGSFSQAEEGAGLHSRGPAVPPEVISAFLQAAHTAPGDAACSLETADADTDIDDDGGGGPLSSMNSGPLQQPLHNPFAVTSSSSSGRQQQQPHHHQQQQQQQQPPAAPGLSTQQQQKQQSGQRSRRASSGRKRPLLARLARGLAITAASAGLLAAGAWAGTTAYRHYMAQLDDRDQLARRVDDLTRAEQRLLLRCTALEQERSGLSERAAGLAAALESEAAVAGRLRGRLQQVEGDREEAVRHNLGLQRKLTNLEESHAALAAEHKEQQAALDAARADAARLKREAGQLSSSIEKLQGRCAELEASSAQLRSDKTTLAAEAQQYKTQAHKLAVLAKS